MRPDEVEIDGEQRRREMQCEMEKKKGRIQRGEGECGGCGGEPKEYE